MVKREEKLVSADKVNVVEEDIKVRKCTRKEEKKIGNLVCRKWIFTDSILHTKEVAAIVSLLWLQKGDSKKKLRDDNGCAASIPQKNAIK